MGIAARKPQASTPRDSILFTDELSSDFTSLVFDVRIPFGIEDTLDISDIQLYVGLASWFTISDECLISDKLFHFYLVNIEFTDTIEIEVYQNFTEQLLAIEEVDSSDAVGRLDNLELDLVLTSTNPAFYKEFAYIDGSLIGYSLYTDSSKSVPIVDVTFGFSGDDLVTKTIHRIADNKTLLITFNYLDGNLVSQTRSLF